MSINSNSSGDSNGTGSSRSTQPRSTGRTSSSSPESSTESERRRPVETPQGAMFSMDMPPASTSSPQDTPRRASLSFARRTDTYATSPQPASRGSRARRPSQSVLVDSGYTPRSQRPSPATSSASSGRSSVHAGSTGSRTASLARMPTEDIEASLAIPRPAPHTASAYPTRASGGGYAVQGQLAGPYAGAAGSPPRGWSAPAGYGGGGSPQTNGAQPPNQQQQQNPYGVPQQNAYQQNAYQQPPLGSSVVPYNPYLFPYPGTDTNPSRPNGNGNYHGRPPRR